MNPVRICYSDLVAAAERRPPGYLERVMAAGTINGEHLVMPLEKYLALQADFPASGPGQDRLDRRRRQTDHPQPIDPPTWSKMLASFTTESIRWAASGFKLAPRDTLQERHRICLECRHWDPDRWAGTGGCRICGCSRLKPFLATTACPDTPPRWSAA